MLVSLLGRPGAEVPLFARLLSARLRAELVSVPAAAAAELAHATHLGAQLQKAAPLIGAPLPAALVAPLVLPKLERATRGAAEPNLVLSGFPRTLEQLTMLQHAGVSAMPRIVHLTLPRAEAERRLASRCVCANCGEAMHTLPPSAGAPAGLHVHLLEEATECEAPKPSRAAADAPDAVRRRLDAFDALTMPLIEKLQARGAEVREVAVCESADETWRAVEAACVRMPGESGPA